MVNAGYFARADQNESDQWQHQHNDSIPFNSDISLNQSNDGRGAYDVNNDLHQQLTDHSQLSQRSSLNEFENLETLMNQQSQSSTGLLDVVEESSENGTKDGSRRDTLRGSDVADGSGLDGDILHFDDNEGSGLMNESELREQGVLFDESSGSHDGNGFHGDGVYRDDKLLAPEDSDLVMKMYMEASPRPPGYPSEEEYEGSENSVEDYVGALKRASVDDIARIMTEGGLSDEDEEEENIPSGYSDNYTDEEHYRSGDTDHRTNGHVSDHEHQKFDMQSRTSVNSNHRTNGHMNGHEQREFDDQLRTSRQSHISDDLSQDESEDGSPELGNTVVENNGHLNAAILAAASKVESFVDEPEGESDATSVSLGQFVPNAVQRTRLPPPGQRRSSVKGHRVSSTDHPQSKPNSNGASSKKFSPRTTPRRSKSNSVRSKSNVSSPRDSVKSVSQYSEQSARESLSQEYLAAAAERDSESQSIGELPTLMSMYLNNRTGFHYQRPDGVPPLDFGNSINSNISFLPRDDDRGQSQAEELAEQLQKDYDELLAKYAQAENTIDQLRLGAKVNLFGDDPVPSQSVQGSHAGAKQPQVIQFGQPQQASVQHVVNVK